MQVILIGLHFSSNTIMKKLSLLAFLFISTIISAQFNVTDYDDVSILDGDTRAFNSTVESNATIYFWINNESQTEDISVRIKLESITNGDGSSYQFCFATNCIFDVTEGTIYPVNTGPVTIPAGGTNAQFDKFFNENEGDGNNYPMDFVWKFFQVDGDDVEIGESITFTYRFDPNLSVNEYQNNLGVTLQNTIAIDFLNVESLNHLNFEILSINGQLINVGELESGLNKITTANLNSGLYFIRFSEGNNSSTLKFVVK